MTDREIELDDKFTKGLSEVYFALEELVTCNRTIARLYPYARQAFNILDAVAQELGDERKATPEARVTRKH